MKLIRSLLLIVTLYLVADEVRRELWRKWSKLETVKG